MVSLPCTRHSLCTGSHTCTGVYHNKNPLIRKRLVPASAAVCAMDALVSKMDTLTVCEPPRRDACEQGKSTAVGAIVCSSALALADDATPAAEQEVPLVVTPSKAVIPSGWSPGEWLQ